MQLLHAGVDLQCCADRLGAFDAYVVPALHHRISENNTVNAADAQHKKDYEFQNLQPLELAQCNPRAQRNTLRIGNSTTRRINLLAVDAERFAAQLDLTHGTQRCR